MKRIFSAIILLLLLFNLASFSATATTDFICSDAQNLLDTAFYKYLSYHWGREMVYLYDEDGEHVLLRLWENLDHVASFDSSTDGQKYSTPVEYRLVKNRYFGDAEALNGPNPSSEIKTPSDAKDFLTESYTNDIAEKMLYKDGVEIFRNDSEDNLYMYVHTFYQFGNYYNIKSLPNTFILNGDAAEIGVILMKHRGGLGGDYTSSNETVEFKKTSDGWRVSGGTAIEVLLGERAPNPNTGDESFLQIVMLGFIAAAAVIGAWSVCRKRRRA